MLHLAACLFALPLFSATSEAPPGEVFGSLEKPITHLVPSPDGKTLYAVGKDGQVAAWERKSGELKWSVKLTVPVPVAAFDVGDERIVYHFGMAVAHSRLPSFFTFRIVRSRAVAHCLRPDTTAFLVGGTTTFAPRSRAAP